MNTLAESMTRYPSILPPQFSFSAGTNSEHTAATSLAGYPHLAFPRHLNSPRPEIIDIFVNQPIFDVYKQEINFNFGVDEGQRSYHYNNFQKWIQLVTILDLSTVVHI